MTADKDRRHTELVTELNRLMAEEIEGYLRYFQLRYQLTGSERDQTKELFNKAMEETREHAEEIAAQLCRMGEIPQLNVNLRLSGASIGLAEALSEALEFERQALEAYRELLPRVSHDSSLQAFIKKQVEIESEHVAEIEDMLK